MGYCKRRCWLLGCQLWVAVLLSLAGVVLLLWGFGAVRQGRYITRCWWDSVRCRRFQGRCSGWIIVINIRSEGMRKRDKGMMLCLCIMLAGSGCRTGRRVAVDRTFGEKDRWLQSDMIVCGRSIYGSLICKRRSGGRRCRFLHPTAMAGSM